MEAEPDGRADARPLGAGHKAKEAMLEHTHIAEAPWHVVAAVDRKRRG
jgi:polyphosphate kinase 2 (PPK2 family)